MSIASEITRLNGAKADIIQAIVDELQNIVQGEELYNEFTVAT